MDACFRRHDGKEPDVLRMLEVDFQAGGLTRSREVIMDVIVGGNVFRNTDGTVAVEGVPQIELVLKQPTGPLLVNFALFDENGRVKAKMVNSSLMFNEGGAYSLTRIENGIVLKHVQNDKVILRAEVREPNTVTVPEAEFVSARGRTLKVTAVDWSIGETRTAQGDDDVKGGSVELG